MFINKVIDHHKNSSVGYRTPKPNIRKFHCNEYFEGKTLCERENTFCQAWKYFF